MSNDNKMRKFYLGYPNLQTVSAKLSWSHFVELLKIADPLERSFYEKKYGNEVRSYTSEFHKSAQDRAFRGGFIWGE